MRKANLLHLVLEPFRELDAATLRDEARIALVALACLGMLAFIMWWQP